MNKILLIDGNPLMWRAVHSKGEHRVTEFIMKYFFDMTSKFQDHQVLMFWDEGKSKWRSEFYPEYKQNREDRKKQVDLEEMKRQKDAAIKYLGFFGVRSILIPGIEADDMISVFSEFFSKCLMYDQVLIATRDRDLWQLITDKVFIYDPYDRTIINQDDVEDQFGLSPKGIAEIKALAGDSSDNIKGIDGVGDKKALKFLTEYGGISGLMSVDAVKGLKKQKISSRVLNDSEDMELSYQLVKLPCLYNFSSYLNDEDLQILKDQCSSSVKANMILARAELDILNLSFAAYPNNGFDGLDNELKRFMLDWLNRYQISEEINISQLDNEISNCNRCFKRLDGYQPQLPKGAQSSDIMIVGKSPFRDNTLVDTLVEALELKPERIWWTYISKCQSDEPLTYGQMKCCSNLLKEEIRLVQPRLIISLGSESMTVLTSLRGRASEYGGMILEKPEGMLGKINSIVCVLLDPALAQRSDKRKVDWFFGVHKLLEFFKEKRGK